MKQLEHPIRRWFAAAFAGGVLGLGLVGPAASADLPAVEKVLARYAEAIGGETVTKVGNMAAEFEFEIPEQGVHSTGVEYWKRPGAHYFRIDLSRSGVPDYEAGATGDRAWVAHPIQGAYTLEGEEKRWSLRNARLNPFAEWGAFFEKAETVARETVRDKVCYKVVFTPDEGETLSSYFDEDTGLLVREERIGPAGVQTVTDLMDYQETQGISSPRTVRRQGSQSYTLKYTNVRYDVADLPEDAFEVPASLKDATH
jgi:hypothetical protein